VYVVAPSLGGFLAGLFQRHVNHRFIRKLVESAEFAEKKYATGMQNKGKKNRNRDFR
jgi:hypothetical protein